jgi:hypothetical protein
MHLVLEQLTLLGVQSAVDLSEPVGHVLQVVRLLLKCLANNVHIVQVNHTAFVSEGPQNRFHQAREYCWSIAKAKGYITGDCHSLSGDELCLLLVTVMQGNLPLLKSRFRNHLTPWVHSPWPSVPDSRKQFCFVTSFKSSVVRREPKASDLPDYRDG